MKTITFLEYLDKSNGDTEVFLIDVETVPVPQKHDYWKRNKNVTDLANLCSECDGTGNEMMWMHKVCKACGGRGYQESRASTSTEITDTDIAALPDAISPNFSYLRKSLHYAD